MKSVAVLGTRELRSVRPEVVRTLRSTVQSVVEAGGMIHTLAAPGCNHMAMETALQAGGRVRCFLAPREPEGSWLRELRQKYPEQLEVVLMDEQTQSRCAEGVRATHPSGRYLSPAATAQLTPLYQCLSDAAAALLLTVVRREGHQYTRGPLETAITFAQARQVPVCDLGDPQQRDAVRSVLSPFAVAP